MIPERHQFAALALRAAVALNDSHTLFASIARPGRHHDIITALVLGGWSGRTSGDRQGFEYNGRFVSRREAAQLTGAVCNHQPGILFTEDLW